MLKIIGKTRIPQLVSGDLNQIERDNAYYLSCRDVGEFSLQNTKFCIESEAQAARHSVVDAVEDQLFGGSVNVNLNIIGANARSLIIFKNVGIHADDGISVCFSSSSRSTRSGLRHRRKAITLGIVLRGTCNLNLHRDVDDSITRTICLQAGDVYLFNQEISHSASHAKRFCAHLSTFIPLQIAHSIPAIKEANFARKPRLSLEQEHLHNL